MGVHVTPEVTAVTDVSILAMSGAGQLLVPYADIRQHLTMQCNQGDLCYSYVNPAPPLPSVQKVTPVSGCFILYQGSTYYPAFGMVKNAVYVCGTSGQSCIATSG